MRGRARVKVGMNTCRSTKGFQSCSQKITVSAAVRLRPRPQARVVIKSIRSEGDEEKDEDEEEEEVVDEEEDAQDRPRL